MRLLLYIVAVMSALIGSTAGYYFNSIELISTGLLTGILFGVMAKICHMLELIEDHLRHIKDMPLTRQRAFGRAEPRPRPKDLPLFGPRARRAEKIGAYEREAREREHV